MVNKSNHLFLPIRNDGVGKWTMLIGDLDIERAQSDPAYLTRVCRVLLSTPRRLRARLPRKQHEFRHVWDRLEPSLPTEAPANPRALGANQSELPKPAEVLANPRSLS
jgi:hypothetical protein